MDFNTKLSNRWISIQFYEVIYYLKLLTKNRLLGFVRPILSKVYERMGVVHPVRSRLTNF